MDNLELRRQAHVFGHGDIVDTAHRSINNFSAAEVRMIVFKPIKRIFV